MVINEYVPIVKAYIDPGTGSAIFTILIGLIGVVFYGVKGLLIKLKSGISKEKVSDTSIPYVIYTDSKRYWNLFKPICDEFERNKTNLEYYTQSQDDPAFTQDYKYVNPVFIGEGNKGITKMNFLNADVVLSTTPSLDVYQWKRSKNVKHYVHIPHACSDITIYRMFGIDYYDSVLTTGEFQINQIRKLEELRNLPQKECKVVGLTYFDEMKQRLDKLKKHKNKTPIVLLAPSWGPSSLLSVYGQSLIDKLLETGYEIIIRPHPQSYISEKELIESLQNKYPNIEWNKDNDNFDVLNKADIMISDFSGVIFDFSLVFDKPVIYTNSKFDDSIYDAWWLKEKLWTFEVLPMLGQELNENNFDDIKSIVSSCLNNKEYRKNRENIRKQAWMNQGKAAKLIFDFMVSKGKEQ